MKGTVKWFNTQKGYGFIVGDDGTDYFVHYSNIKVSEFRLGKQTGKMAAEILKGEKKASDMNFETITEPGFYVNEKVAENLGVTVPQDLADEAVESFTEITK